MEKSTIRLFIMINTVFHHVLSIFFFKIRNYFRKYMDELHPCTMHKRTRMGYQGYIVPNQMVFSLEFNY